jgi:UDP-glucose 4-epimerase
MRVVVGVAGNVGTSLRWPSEEAAVDTIVGVARRLPALELPKTEWRTADVARDDLRPRLHRADAVVQLA